MTVPPPKFFLLQFSMNKRIKVNRKLSTESRFICELTQGDRRCDFWIRNQPERTSRHPNCQTWLVAARIDSSERIAAKLLPSKTDFYFARDQPILSPVSHSDTSVSPRANVFRSQATGALFHNVVDSNCRCKQLQFLDLLRADHSRRKPEECRINRRILSLVWDLVLRSRCIYDH